MQNSNRWPLQSAVDWFMCALCGHLALPWLFKCTCRKCQRFGLNLDEQKRTFGQEIEKRLRYLFKLLYMSINASFLLGFWCKTENCSHWTAATYIGEFDTGETFTSFPPSPRFDFRCERCGKGNSYPAADLNPTPLASAVPDFRPLF